MAQEKRGIHQARATFFVTGPRVDEAQQLQRWLEGHKEAALVKPPFHHLRQPCETAERFTV